MDTRLSMTLLGIFVAVVFTDVVLYVAIKSFGVSDLLAFAIALVVVIPVLILALRELAKV
jgi:hypothetical protein